MWTVLISRFDLLPISHITLQKLVCNYLFMKCNSRTVPSPVNSVIPVPTGIQNCSCESRGLVEKTWIHRIKYGAGSAGVYPDGNRGRNEKLEDHQSDV